MIYVEHIPHMLKLRFRFRGWGGGGFSYKANTDGRDEIERDTYIADRAYIPSGKPRKGQGMRESMAFLFFSFLKEEGKEERDPIRSGVFVEKEE